MDKTTTQKVTISYTPKGDFYNWFQTGKIPTELQFRNVFDSYWHKSESIPMDCILGLNDAFNIHYNDAEAHNQYLAKKDSSNLSNKDVAAWNTKLQINKIIDERNI